LSQHWNLLFVSQQLTTELAHSKLKYGLVNSAVSSMTYRQWCSPRDQSLGLEAPRGQK